MAARSVRRSFASPFVVTLAAALPAASCYVQPASGPQGPQTGAQTTGPTGTGGSPTDTPDHATTTAGVEQAPAAGTTVIANPPRPTPATSDRTWTVTRQAGACSSTVMAACPTPLPGQPAPTCNPPPPTAYACLPSMTTDGAQATIVQFKGQTTCQLKQPPISCPPNVMCNPPPPQKVACPQ